MSASKSTSLMRDFMSLPEFDLMFMFAIKSYLHSWCFQCSSRPISNFLTVFACITDSGRLFHISTILTTKVYFLTFSLHAQFMEITCIFPHNLVMLNILFSIKTILSVNLYKVQISTSYKKSMLTFVVLSIVLAESGITILTVV